MPDNHKELKDRLRELRRQAVSRTVNVGDLETPLFDAADLIESLERERDRNAAVLEALTSERIREASEAAIDGSDVLSPTWGDWPLDGLIETVLQAALQHAQEQVEEEPGDREYMDGDGPGGKCPCGKPDPGIKPEGGCWCTEDEQGRGR